MNTTIPHRHLKIAAGTLAIGLALVSGQPSPTLAQPSTAPVPAPALTVDATADNTSISPDIYGMNLMDTTDLAVAAEIADLHLPVNRWGGNSTTRYNYQNDVTNLANDWYFENARQGNGAHTQDDSAVNQFISTNTAARTKTLLTVPTIGYVANDHDIDNLTQYYCGFDVHKYASQAQTGTDPWRADCGTGVLAGGGYVTNEPNGWQDTSIPAEAPFVQDWVAYLRSHFGSDAPEYYALDNEPDLWYSTHRDVHPLGAGYDELFNTGRDYAIAIKAAYPDAKVFGPVSWGWTGYFWSAQDIAEGRPYYLNNAQSPDRWSHSNTPFLVWYLQKMKQYETDNGVRLLDYLDLHFYTQALYMHNPGVTLGPAGDASVKAARLNSTRSLWDPTYLEQSDGSWIDQPVMLIPRMHAWVNDSVNGYPGTLLALTEYNWGGLEDINGALAQADVLGIFGREQLDLATLWAPPSPTQPGAYAFRMYLNYDGSGGHFGDTNVRAASTDQGRLAIYGSKDSTTGDLKLMVINKTDKPITSSVTLNNFNPALCATSFTYSPANLSAIVHSWQAVSAGTFPATFPGQSITLLVIPPNSGGLSCDAPPSPAMPSSLSTPPRGGYTSVTQPRFTWRAVKGARAYFVQVSDNQSFTNPIIDDQPVQKATLAPPSPLAYGTYYWRVRALTTDGITDYSQPATFDVTLLKAPRNNQVVNTSRPKFVWTPVKTAPQYQVTVSKNGDLTSPEFTQTTPAASLVSPAALDPGVYYWRVGLVSSGEVTPTWSFIVTPARAPTNGQVVITTRPKLSWVAVPGAQQYQVQLDNGVDPAIDFSTQATSTTPPSTLNYGHYTWQIKADTSSVFTPALSFDVTFLRRPANRAFLTASPVFLWGRVPGAGSYHLEVFPGSPPSGPAVIDASGLTGLNFRVSTALERGAYTWQVSTNTGQVSPAWSFTVGP